MYAPESHFDGVGEQPRKVVEHGRITLPAVSMKANQRRCHLRHSDHSRSSTAVPRSLEVAL